MHTVDAAQVVDGALHQSSDRRFIARVELLGDRKVAISLDEFHRSPCRRLTQVTDDNTSPFLREPACRGTPDARPIVRAVVRTRAARADDNDLALEAPHGSRPPKSQSPHVSGTASCASLEHGGEAVACGCEKALRICFLRPARRGVTLGGERA